MEDILVAVCEMTSLDNIVENEAQLFSLMKEAVSGGADLISFPENALYLRIDEAGEKFALQKDDPVFSRLSEFAIENKTLLHIGSVPVFEGEKIFNSTLMIDDNGKCDWVYSKIHLFDIELKGRKPVKESDYYCPGNEPAIFNWRGLKFGMSICYDLRFAELYSYYAGTRIRQERLPAQLHSGEAG